MRITISHNKSRPEIVQAVDKTVDDMFKGLPMAPIEIRDQQKKWDGNTLTFSLTAKAGFLQTPIHGTVLVGDKDVTIDVDLGIFSKFISEEKAKTALETRVRGLLG
jgi:hypothetical protein